MCIETNCDRKERMKYTKRAAEIVSSLSLHEKVSLMSGNMSFHEVRSAIRKKGKAHYNEIPYQAGGIREKGIPSVLFVDGTRGVVCGEGDNVCFPVALMRGASFDVELEEEIGEVIAEEVLEAGGNLFGGVCVNLPYHPGWGRCQESYGEDSCLLGKMGAALIRGVQKRGVIACVKHFAFNSMEDARFHVNITCSKRTEREMFLPHFKACIDAGAGAVMSAYNCYQGVLCGHQEYLLKKILKEEWRFDGFVLSDFTWGIRDTAEAMKGGLDIEMPVTHYYGEKLIKAVSEGKIKEAAVDDAVLRIVRTLLAFQEKQQRNKEMQNEKRRHIKLALQSAREGITLLQNKNGKLPLKCNKKTNRIAVLGYLSDRNNTGDHGSSQVYPQYIVTALQGIVKAAGEAEIISYTGSSAAHCKRLAKEADEVIIIVGNDYRDEGEYIAADESDLFLEKTGGDRRESLGLKKRDMNIIQAVYSVRKDAVVILEGGGMLMIGDWKEKVSAVLMGYYPGMEGGTALGEVLFGKINPSGKLPFSVPEKQEHLPHIDWDAKVQWYEYYSGYMRLDKNGWEPAFPFGFGMSYTEFEVKNLKGWVEDDRLCASVQVCNIGGYDGAEVIQMYVGMPDSKVERPKRVLKDFRRIELKKGERKTVQLSCNLQDMAFYEEETERFIVEHIRYELYIGTSSALSNLKMVSVLC